MLFVACGNKTLVEIIVDKETSEYTDVDPSSLEDLFEYEIVQGKYPIILKDNQLSITLKLKVVEQIEKSEVDFYTFKNFKVDFLGENNEYIDSDFFAIDGETKAFELLNSANGNIIEVTFVSSEGNEEALKTLASTIKELDDVTLKMKESKNKKRKSGDWDKILDEYEKTVDAFVIFSKKALSGDEDAVREYTNALTKVESLEEELEKVNEEMSPKQIERYERITQKLLDAYSAI